MKRYDKSRDDLKRCEKMWVVCLKVLRCLWFAARNGPSQVKVRPNSKGMKKAKGPMNLQSLVSQAEDDKLWRLLWSDRGPRELPQVTSGKPTWFSPWRKIRFGAYPVQSYPKSVLSESVENHFFHNFSTKLAVSESMSYPKVVSRRCRDSVPPSLPQQRWISFNFWGVPSFWTHFMDTPMEPPKNWGFSEDLGGKNSVVDGLSSFSRWTSQLQQLLPVYPLFQADPIFRSLFKMGWDNEAREK